MTFGERAAAAIRARGRLCVGIDPHPALLSAWLLRDDVAGLETFAMKALEAVGSIVPMIKPQSAFFERFGGAGILVLERLIREARAAGVLVLLDAKRGDVASTNEGYADAYLDRASPLYCDAVTVHPYLGFDSLQPMFDKASANDAGVFVLAFTSNPEAQTLQRSAAAADQSEQVGRAILRQVREMNALTTPMGSIGVVVGATVEPQGDDFDINGPILAPGFGHQGGGIPHLRRLFGRAESTVFPSTSRELLSIGPDRRALQEACRRLNDELVA